jgi:hypothetical protein
MNQIASNVLTAVVTAAILGVGAGLMGVFEKGAIAINDDQIEEVVNRVMVTAAGTTVKARIAEVDGVLINLETRAGILEDDVEDLEDAVMILASD